MARKNKKRIGFNTYRTPYYYSNKVTEPKDTNNYEKMAFVFFDQKSINELKNKCIDKAGSNEFQFGYRALLVRLKKGNGEIGMFFPTSFYNFTQEVGYASVDYDLQDIEKEATVSKPASLSNSDALIKSMPIFEMLKKHGYEVIFQEGNFGSIHRHPGQFGFSQIDLRKDPNDPGVVYRQAEADDMWQADSIMYIPDGDTEIYTTECRIVTVKPSEDGGVDGTYCKIPTTTIVKPSDFSANDIVSAVEEVMGVVEKDIFDRYKIKGLPAKFPLLEAILDMYKGVDVPADISNVDANRIDPKYPYSNFYSNNYHRKGGYGYYSDKRTTKKTKKNISYAKKEDIVLEILSNCPLNMGNSESEYLYDILDKFSRNELKKVHKISEKMYDAYDNAYIEDDAKMYDAYDNSYTEDDDTYYLGYQYF